MLKIIAFSSFIGCLYLLYNQWVLKRRILSQDSELYKLKTTLEELSLELTKTQKKCIEVSGKLSQIENKYKAFNYYEDDQRLMMFCLDTNEELNYVISDIEEELLENDFKTFEESKALVQAKIKEFLESEEGKKFYEGFISDNPDE